MTHRRTTPPVSQILPFAPPNYDREYMDRLIQLLRQFISTTSRNVSNPTFINVDGMPLNGNDLPPWTVFIDGNHLVVALPGTLYPPHYGLEAELNDVTWSIS